MATKIWTGAVDGNWSTSGNWTSAGAPSNGDTVYLSGSVAITAGLSTGLTGINLYVDQGCTAPIASSAGYLSIACATFRFSGSGQAYIDLGSSNIAAVVTATNGGTSTTSGLYLKGSNLLALDVSGGSVALAGLDGETSTVATMREVGSASTVVLGPGVTLTTASVSSGTLTVGCAATALTVNSGVCTTFGSGAIGTITIIGGLIFPYSTGLVTTFVINGGIASFIGFPVERTVTNLQLNAGGQLIHDPVILTITTKTNPNSPVRVTATAA